MTTNPETPEEEVASPVEETPAPPKKPARKKAAPRKRKATAKKAAPKKPKKKAPTIAEAEPLTLEEIKEKSKEVKDGFVDAVVGPFIEAAGVLSQTARDTVGGALDGLLSRKRKK
jgi:hypothetical protein